MDLPSAIKEFMPLAKKREEISYINLFLDTEEILQIESKLYQIALFLKENKTLVENLCQKNDDLIEWPLVLFYTRNKIIRDISRLLDKARIPFSGMPQLISVQEEKRRQYSKDF